MRRPLVFLSAAILGAVVMGGCGGDRDIDATAGGSRSDALEIVARDIEFDKSRYDATEGMVELHYVNRGSIAHTLVIEGIDGFKLAVTSKGDDDQGNVDLESGSYTFYCDVPGHRAAGMEAVLEVT